MKIAIFGAGAFGSALGEILISNGHQVDYYDPAKYPDKNLTSVIDGSEVNILAVPSSAAPKLMLFLPHDKPLICASKGFLSMASFKQFGANFSIISGGAFAADLESKKKLTLTATSDLVEQLFKTDWLSFDRTTDQIGAMLCGSFKNVYAIGAGYWELKYATPDFDDFINSVMNEMRLILMNNGGKPETVSLSCGLNDLVVTCASPTSRNYEFGMNLKKDQELGKKALTGAVRLPTTEGLTTIEQISKTSSFVKPKNTPILDRIISLATNTPIVRPEE